MEKKLGVYICGGCSIGEGLDLEKLSLVATKEYKSLYAKPILPSVVRRASTS